MNPGLLDHWRTLYTFGQSPNPEKKRLDEVLNNNNEKKTNKQNLPFGEFCRSSCPERRNRRNQKDKQILEPLKRIENFVKYED